MTNNRWMYSKIREDESGIYRISLINRSVCYIGMSKHVSNRWNEHMRSLKKNKHHCHSLQKLYNKYGIESFKFEIIELNAVSKLGEREQIVWDEHKSDGWKMLNSRPDGRGGYEMSENTKMLIKESNQWFYELNRGKKRPEHAELMRSLRGSKGENSSFWQPDLFMYWCEDCEYGTRRSGDFSIHLKNKYHSTGKKYSVHERGKYYDWFLEEKNIFYCGYCDYENKHSSDFEKHLKRSYHLNNIKNIPNIHQKIIDGLNYKHYRYDISGYYCEGCKHFTKNSASFTKHLATARHLTNIKGKIQE